MVKLSATEIADKWRRRAEASASDYQKGIERVSESPMEKAVAKKDKFKANLMKAIDDGKWEKGLKSVSLTDWKDSVAKKGVPNYATGIRASESKMEKFMTELIPYQETLQGVINRMPDITLNDSIARASAWIEGMAKFKQSKHK